MAWKDEHPEFDFEAVGELSLDDFNPDNIEDSKRALICPKSGTIMRKFRISAASSHKLDYSAAVGGLWLDNGEWELLKQEGLAGHLNAIFTQAWQNKVRQDNSMGNFGDIYQDKFGQQTYQKVKEFRDWLGAQPNRAELRAYLAATDPYSAEK